MWLVVVSSDLVSFGALCEAAEKVHKCLTNLSAVSTVKSSQVKMKSKSPKKSTGKMTTHKAHIRTPFAPAKTEDVEVEGKVE